jgi:type IV pilus assembly protein PilZ
MGIMVTVKDDPQLDELVARVTAELAADVGGYPVTPRGGYFSLRVTPAGAGMTAGRTMGQHEDSDPPASTSDPPASVDRRISARYEVTWAVDCVAEDTFLYASLANISEMGIFVRTTEPLAIGTRLTLSFSPPGHEPFKLQGQVAWVNKLRLNGDNPNPGMGLRFISLTPDDRERLVEVIRAICYLREQLPS